MSIVAVTDNVIIVDCQAAFSQGLYADHSKQWLLKPGDFDILEPYFRSSQHRSKKQKTIQSNVADVDTDKRHQDIRAFLLTCIQEAKKLWPSEKNKANQNETMTPLTTEANLMDFTSLVSMAQVAIRFAIDSGPMELTQDCTSLDTLDVFNTIIVNPSQTCCKTIKIEKNRYIIPPQASFLMGDMAEMPAALSDFAESLGGFQFVVLDPPWPNKSVQRSAHYESQDIYDLFQIPMSALLAEEDALVAVWVTNKPKFRKFVITKLFPSWQLQCVGEWHWLKMTTQGELVLPLDSPHRKPYEQLIIGSRGHTIALPYSKTIASVPSKRHSRKPPLQDVMAPFLPTHPQCLELFARCLTPGWTSWGNECLKFQDENYFTLSSLECKEEKRTEIPK